MINFFTIVLDGEPWIERHYPVFLSLKIPWTWTIVEGVANNVNCTKWCASIPPRLSQDGTTEYLRRLYRDNRVTIMERPLWDMGKIQMCNAALSQMRESGLLWEVDSDELWTRRQIETIDALFHKLPDRNCAWFWCRYFVGPEIITMRPDAWSNNPAYEWKRVWRFQPGMRFARHEPPVLVDLEEKPITHSETERVGAVFDHQAYSTIEQVRFKQRYYAGANNPNAKHYEHLEEDWRRLQANTHWPEHLSKFFGFVPDSVMVDRVAA